MLLSIPRTVQQPNVMDKTPVPLIQSQTSCRMEGLITELLQTPFNWCFTHHICFIPLNYHGASTVENVLALQAQKVSLKRQYKCHSHREGVRKTRGDAECMQREKTSSVKLLGCGSTQTERKHTTWKEICNKCEVVKSFCLRSRLKLREPRRGTEHWLRCVRYLQIKHGILHVISTTENILWQQDIKRAIEVWIEYMP